MHFSSSAISTLSKRISLAYHLFCVPCLTSVWLEFPALSDVKRTTCYNYAISFYRLLLLARVIDVSQHLRRLPGTTLWSFDPIFPPISLFILVIGDNQSKTDAALNSAAGGPNWTRFTLNLPPTALAWRHTAPVIIELAAAQPAMSRTY